MTSFEWSMPQPESQLWPCCDVAAWTQGDRCACWIVEVTPEQAPLLEGPPFLRRKACEDCAYRADSVERAAGEPPEYGPDQPVYCHWGAPMVVRFRHPPSGTVIEVEPGTTYDPVDVAENRWWKASGQPGELCAVWGATNAIRRTR